MCCFIRFCCFTWSYISIYSFIYYISSVFSKSSVDVVFLEWSHLFFWNIYSFFVNISDFLFYARSIISWSFITFCWIDWASDWIFNSLEFKTIFFLFTSSVRLFCITSSCFTIFSFSFYDISILIFCDIFVVFLEWTALLNSSVNISYFLFSIFYIFSCSKTSICIWCCTIRWFNFFKFVRWLIYFLCCIFFTNFSSFNIFVGFEVCWNNITIFIYCFVNVMFLEWTCFCICIFSVYISYFKVFTINIVSCNWITCNIFCYFSWFSNFFRN